VADNAFASLSHRSRLDTLLASAGTLAFPVCRVLPLSQHFVGQMTIVFPTTVGISVIEPELCSVSAVSLAGTPTGIPAVHLHHVVQHELLPFPVRAGLCITFRKGWPPLDILFGEIVGPHFERGAGGDLEFGFELAEGFAVGTRARSLGSGHCS
jgi:hypothetical protein